jgi:hypothetical protein
MIGAIPSSLVTDAYFRLSRRDGASATYTADPATGGPWAPHLQHGGPPTALLVHEAERLVAAQTGRTDLVATRIAAEFVGPVPVAEVRVSAELVRAARAAALVDVRMAAAGRECLHGRVWFVRAGDTAAVAPALPDPGAPLEPIGDLGADFPYGASIEWRPVRGGLRLPGPGAVWGRPRIALVDDEPAAGLRLAALIGDSASGISAELDWLTWSFLNIDLDIHLLRALEGEWVFLDAVTHLGPAGSGMARSVLSDVRGMVGATLQTLVVESHR